MNTRRMTESAILIAIATLLSLPFLTIAAPWIAGGSVTFGSMLPLVFITHRYGTRWGIGTALVYSLVQLILGLNNIGYAPNALAAAAIILLDYVLAFGALGLSAVLNPRFKNRLSAILAGIVFTFFLRFVCHFLSGFIIWDAIWPNENGTAAWLYSLAYNGAYMLPETLISLGIAAFSYPALKRFWMGQDLASGGTKTGRHSR